MCKDSYTIHTFSSAPRNDLGEYTAEEIKNSILYAVNQTCIKEWKK